MISAIIILVLSCSLCCSAQITTITVGDDQSNWAEILKALNKSKSDGRSGLEISVFERILRANAIARGQGTGRSGSDDFLFQGDIQLNRSEIGDILGSPRRKRAVGKTSAIRRWQRNNIAYSLVYGSLGKRAISVIRQAVGDWETILDCMGKWKDVTSSIKKPRNYMQFFRGAGCYSRVGRQFGRQKISIGSGCDYRGVVIHEIGHAMGFWHEQSRPDRDSYVKINWQNIIPAMKFNFNKYTTSKINSLGVDYDYESVMHYGSKAFSKNGYPTIQVKDNSRIRFGQRRRLSSKDKEQARLMYGCKAVVSCQDTQTLCPNWGKAGYCNPETKYADYMKRECCKTCQSIITGSCKVKTTKGECCVFPFQYKNKQYNSCTTVDNENTSWCATTNNYDSDRKWGTCNGVFPCNSSPCLNAGTCSNQRVGFKCRCNSGFKGLRCEQKVFPCNSSPCLNAGTCSNQRAGFKCRCNSGFKGLRCEQKVFPCDSLPCLNGGACSNQGAGFKCRCNSGFKGLKCEQKVFLCNSSPCLNAGTCSNEGSRFKCFCTSGFIGLRCEQRIFPCDSSPCLNGGACSNQGAGFKCRCNSGFKGLKCEQKGTSCTKDISKANQCAGWKASGFCKSSSKWSNFMIKNCCFTCQTGCKDKNVHCKQWADMGFCTSIMWTKSMKIHCAKACGC